MRVVAHSQLLCPALILPHHVRIVEAGRQGGDGKHDNHGLETRRILRGLARDKELRANDESNRVANKQDGAGHGTLRVAGDVGRRESEHHRQRTVGEIGAVESNKAPDAVLDREGVDEDGPDNGRDVANKLHQTTGVGIVVGHEAGDDESNVLRQAQRGVKQRGLKASVAETCKTERVRQLELKLVEAEIV